MCLVEWRVGPLCVVVCGVDMLGCGVVMSLELCVVACLCRWRLVCVRLCVAVCVIVCVDVCE